MLLQKCKRIGNLSTQLRDPEAAGKFEIGNSQAKLECGFTLIELLITIAIVGIISTIGFYTYSSSQAKARDAKRKQDIHQIQTALQLYYNDHGYYPYGSSADTTCQQNNYYFSTCSTPPWIPGLTSSYIPALPVDSNGYQYIATCPNSGPPQGYFLGAKLENQSDPQMSTLVPAKISCTGFALSAASWYFIGSP